MTQKTSLLSKWQAIPHKMWGISMGVTILFSGYIMLQNQQIHDANDIIRQENAELRHGQKDEWTLKLVGMKNTATKLELGYKSMKSREAQYILFNQRNPCSALPVNLAVAEPDLTYEPPEAVYMKTLNAEDYQN